MKGSEIDFANAHLGLGNLELDLGHFERAERHYWKAVQAAMRVGRKSLAGSAHHNLMHLMSAVGRDAEARMHAEKAVMLHPVGHPQLPSLAHDVAFLFLWEGYFSSARPILERVLPWVEGQRKKIAVLASLARCAAAVKDHIPYERAAAQVVMMAAEDDEMSDSSLYHIAEGARSFWDWTRAEAYGNRALQVALKRENTRVAALAQSLLDAVSAHRVGDIDLIPADASDIENITVVVLRKLAKQPAPGVSPRAVPPECYPTQ